MKQPHPLWADEAEAEAGKVRLDGLHRAKVRLADEVLVVGDYIGTPHAGRNRLRPGVGEARPVHAPRGRPGGEAAVSDLSLPISSRARPQAVCYTSLKPRDAS